MRDVTNVWASALLWGFENGYPLPFSERGPTLIGPFAMDLAKLRARYAADRFDITRHLPGNY